MRELALAIYRDALAALEPGRLARAAAPPRADALWAIGKAARAMRDCCAATSTLTVGPEDASHPVPDARSLAAGRELLARAAALPDGAEVVLALSGGASALAVAPAWGLTLDEKVAATSAVSASGADIAQLNCVRKHLSALKGGRLAVAAARAHLTLLVLSDVVGDDPAVIGSGPATADPTTFADALAIARRAGVGGRPLAALEAGARGELPETPKRVANVATVILAGPASVGQAAARAAEARGLAAVVEPMITDDVELLAARLAARAREQGPARISVFPGEPTIRLPPRPGRGGRAQHSAVRGQRRPRRPHRRRRRVRRRRDRRLGAGAPRARRRRRRPLRRRGGPRGRRRPAHRRRHRHQLHRPLPGDHRMTRALALLLLAASSAAAEPVELRVATLAPAGSAWARIMEQGAARLAEETAGRARMRFYFGGAQGDERDVVRKMRLGQLDGAALTAVGLGLIHPDVLVLQLPYLFSSERQLDRTRDAVTPELARGFAEAGFVLLAWGDLGWVHTFSTVEIKTAADLRAVRFAQLADDPISRELYAVLGLNGVPLAIPEILPALQTGSVQACAGPPLGAVALQWYPRLRFMTDRPASYAIGALVLTRRSFERLAPADRELLLAGARQTGAELVASVRRDNERAKNAIRKAGVAVVAVPDDAHALFALAGRQVWQRLAGKLYPRELLDRVVRLAAEPP
jgi:glycerate-2-kinase/TRAP-type C4-dicarboxylate transport system substrate-binding protein